MEREFAAVKARRDACRGMAATVHQGSTSVRRALRWYPCKKAGEFARF